MSPAWTHLLGSPAKQSWQIRGLGDVGSDYEYGAEKGLDVVKSLNVLEWRWRVTLGNSIHESVCLRLTSLAECHLRLIGLPLILGSCVCCVRMHTCLSICLRVCVRAHVLTHVWTNSTLKHPLCVSTLKVFKKDEPWVAFDRLNSLESNVWRRKARQDRKRHWQGPLGGNRTKVSLVSFSFPMTLCWIWDSL